MITLTEEQCKQLQVELDELFGLNMWGKVAPTNLELDGQIPFDDLYKAVTIIQEYVKPEDFTTATWWQVVKATNEAAMAEIEKSEIFTLAESLRMIENIKRRSDEFGKLLGME